MPVYIGFSTQHVSQPRTLTRPGISGGVGGIVDSVRVGKKFRLTDEQLVVQDLLNSLSIKQGDKVGKPDYGTTIWNYVFEPNTPDLRNQVENEIRRLASSDPRLIINTITVFEQENGLLIEMEFAVSPFNNASQIGFFLNRFNGSIQQLAQ